MAYITTNSLKKQNQSSIKFENQSIQIVNPNFLNLKCWLKWNKVTNFSHQTRVPK